MSALAYVLSVVIANWLFAVIPPLMLPGGQIWSPAALVVGFIFVLRDFAQREIGHYVWLAMLAAAGVSYFMADPFVAAASLTAFLIAEAVDWSVYTFTRRPLRDRVLLSSALSAPVDTIVFLWLIGQLGAIGAAVMIASKMAGAMVVFFLLPAGSKKENSR